MFCKTEENPISSNEIEEKEKCRLLGCYGIVALERTDVSEERIAFVIRVTRLGELRTTLAISSNRCRKHPLVGFFVHHRAGLGNCGD
jgi:hypothetical protein